MSAIHPKIDTLLANAVVSGDVPGVVAMATGRTGLLYAGAHGQRTLGAHTPMTLDTVVWIASMTKALTGAAAMQLVERGQLELDAPASAWVPELGSVQVLEGFDVAGAPRLRPPVRPITLRHLLTHTAGYGYPVWSEALARYHEVQGLPSTSTCRNAALLAPLLFDPGERWNYGINIEWAGKMIEAVSGQRLGIYLAQHLLEPLGMTSTAFKITTAMRSRLAKVHERAADGSLSAIEFEVPQEPEFELGGGGLYSTAGDYLRFVRMILDNGKSSTGERLLAPETVDLMSRNHIGELAVVKLQSCMPNRSNDAEFFPGTVKRWGLTFMINEEAAPTGRSAGSLAWGGLANTYFWIDRTRGVGGVYLTQILPFADSRSLPLYLEFEKTVYQALAS
jgi:CubicO group peptidase (beta-lactamase class C family)